MRRDRLLTTITAGAVAVAAVACGATDDSSSPDPIAPPVLRAEGVGPHDFGADAEIVLADLRSAIGDAASDAVVAVVPGLVEGEPPPDRLRDVCFSNGFCAHFATGADARLLGWRQLPGDGALVTSAGIGPGASGADHVDAIEVGLGGCFEIGEGQADGVSLELESIGVPFVVIDTGKRLELESSPPVEDVIVRSLWSGAQVEPPATRC